MLYALIRDIPVMLADAGNALFPRVVNSAARREFQPDPPDAYCHRCGITMGPGGVTDRGCSHCINQPIHWDRIIRLAAYRDPLRQSIHHMKFRGQWVLAKWLGQQLAHALGSQWADAPAVIVPVPMHWRRRWRRGYNQATLLARALARDRHWPLSSALKRTRYTRAQSAVAPSQRLANIRDSFALRRRHNLRGKTVILVDDIKTTGSTAAACTRLLKHAGAKKVIVLVVAVADPPDQPTPLRIDTDQ